MKRRCSLLGMALVTGFTCVTLAADVTVSPSAGIPFFEAKIRPVLVAQCYECHSSEGKGLRGGLAVDSQDALHAGGESGPAIVPGKLDESLLWNAINYQDLEMPPKRRLSANVIEDFRQWIEMGAPDPRTSTGTVVRSKVTEEDIENGKQFWSFKAPAIIPPRVPRNALWPKSEIDRYVADQLANHELQPTQDAEPTVLVRRLYFDLIGLPPTIAQVLQFGTAWSQDSQSAVGHLVDQLLESPQYGERWGRHWLDVARYAESTGKEVDMTFPNAWRYRNYVIDSFNRDKPYDQFVREQIAGDLIPAKNDAEWGEHLIATGFLALGPKALIEQNPRQFQADLIDEQIDTTTRVILGVSVACARCHDHKFDPISQEDYYALAGIFESTETFFGGSRSQRNRQPSNVLVLPFDDPNPNVKPISKSELAELKQSLKEREAEYVEARRAMRQPTTNRSSQDNAKRPPLLNAAILDQVVASISSRIHGVDENGKPVTSCMGVQPLDRPKNARVLVRGEINQPAQEVPRGFVKVLSQHLTSIAPNSSGRQELAQWLTARENPLTARVMVNRVWQHLLGQPIVRETENFGASGESPTHPELLDYLAIQFMDHGWSLKQLIREIATSRVYGLSSNHDDIRFEKDPDNRYLSRANVRRLDAEALRDAMLAASGQLDLKRPKASLIASFGMTLIGPNGPISLPPAIVGMAGERGRTAMATMVRPGMMGGGNPLDVPSYIRSVYLPVARNSLPRALDVFDFAEPSIIVGQRETSHTAEQALFMLNNPFVIEQSDALARRLIKEYPNERIGSAFLLVYGRRPTKTELRNSTEFLRDAAVESISGTREQRAFRALSQFCQALWGAAEFRFVN